MAITAEVINGTLKGLADPGTQKDYISKNIQINDSCVTLDIELSYPAKSKFELIKKAVEEKIQSIPGVSSVTATILTKIASHVTQGNLQPLKEVKNIIAVASGKGGVGKSTTAVNLALALADEGANVGMLDADIYGPCLPQMLNLVGRVPESKDGGQTILPLESYYGLQVMSIGFMVDTDSPVIWRGPMVTHALEKLLTQTCWNNLDYLVIDMPPGTGDTQLTLAQKVPVTGALIVTTPQDIALIDARKGLKMFEKVHIPILGVVENMSTYICSKCGHEERIFGHGGGVKMCKDYNVALLGSLPLDISIREFADSGKPTVVGAPDSHQAEIYRAIARRAAIKISESAKNPSTKFPNIVVQST